MKYVTLLVTLAIAAVRMYYVFQNHGQMAQKTSAGFPGVPPAQAAQIAEATRHTPTPERPRTAAAPAPSTTAAAPDPVRQEIEGQLRALKVTSIMPGEPGLVIIDKESYAEGDDLPLAKGRKLRVVKVREDGIMLTANGQSFHLDPPAAPDLAASRKKR